jgi:hypothetical protein
MASKKKQPEAPSVPNWQDNPPAGATRKALGREQNGGGPPGSPLGDRHADGTPMGDTERQSELEDALGQDAEAFRQEGGPYGGPSGGAVGGTPAEGRSAGGNVGPQGMSPGGVHRGDSTIGSK